MLRWEPESLRFLTQFSSLGQRFFKPNASSGGVASGDESAARWRAHWRSRIGVDETNALGGETIQLGGLIVRPTVATQVAVTKIIGEYEQNVWTN